MSYALRLGHPAVTTRGPVRLPIEGARAVVDDGAVVVLIGFRDPTPDERAAVEREPVDLATLARRGAVALVFEIGDADHPGHVACVAPVNLLDDQADPSDFLDSDDPAAIRFALCDTESGVVRALRLVDAPAHVLRAVREHGRAQVAAFDSDLQVREASLRLLHGETVPALLAQAERHVCA